MATYKSARRANAAAETREAIVASARALFLAEGYGSITVPQIAEAAGVAVQTVYASAGGKAEILRVILEPAIHDPNVDITMRAITEAEHPSVVIDLIARGTRRAHERHWPVLFRLIRQTWAEPAAAAVVEAGIKLYLETLEVTVDRLLGLGGLRPELDRRHAVDLLWFHVGQGAWFTFVGDRGWTFDEAEAWLASAAKRALLTPESIS